MVLVGNRLFAGGGGVSSIDVSDPSAPRLMDRVQGDVENLAWLSDSWLAGSGGHGLYLVDITDPGLMRATLVAGRSSGYGRLASQGNLLAAADLTSVQLFQFADGHVSPLASYPVQAGWVRDVCLSGPYLYIAAADGKLEVVSLLNPASPSFLGALARDPVAVLGVDSLTALGNQLLRTGYGNGLELYSIQNPAHPAVVGQVRMTVSTTDVVITNGLACLVDATAGLQVLAVDSRTNFSLLGTLDVGDQGNGAYYKKPKLALRLPLALATDSAEGLKVIDISDPRHPVLMGTNDPGNGVYSVATKDEYAYVVHFEGMAVVSLRNPRQPATVGTVGGRDSDTVTVGGGLALLTRYLDASVRTNWIEVYGLSDPAHPALLGTLPNQTGPVAIDGTRAFCGNGGGGFSVFDVADPARPMLLARSAVGYGGLVTLVGDRMLTRALSIYHLDAALEAELVGLSRAAGTPNAICYANGLAYLASGSKGLQVLDLDRPACLQRLGRLDTGGLARRLVPDGSLVWLVDGTNGVAAVNLSDPANPRLVGGLDTAGEAWDIARQGQVAYVADGANGLLALDVSEPTKPRQVGRVVLEDAVYRLALAPPYLWGAAGYYGGLVGLDISVPAAPRVIGSVLTPGDPRALAVRGRYAYVADGPAGLQIVDLATPTAPRIVSTWPTIGRLNDVTLADDGRMLGAVEDDNATVQGRGLLLFDLASPESPRLLGSYRAAVKIESVVLSGRIALLALGDSGIEVIDWTDPVHCARLGANGMITPLSAVATPWGAIVGAGAQGVATLRWLEGRPPGTVAFGALSVGTDGVAALSVEGRAGSAVRVQRSVDLRDWQDWQSVGLTNSPTRLADPDTAGQAWRFYRAISP
jgi:hypothetical protein